VQQFDQLFQQLMPYYQNEVSLNRTQIIRGVGKLFSRFLPLPNKNISSTLVPKGIYLHGAVGLNN